MLTKKPVLATKGGIDDYRNLSPDERQIRLKHLNDRSKKLDEEAQRRSILPKPPPPPKRKSPPPSHTPQNKSILPPPPPPPKMKIRGSDSKGIDSGEVKHADQKDKKEYLEKHRTPLWLQTLRDSKRRMAVYTNGRESAHIYWIKKSGQSMIPRINPDSVTGRYLAQEEGTRDNRILLEAEKAVMQSFSEAKSMFPEGKCDCRGIVVVSQGEDVGLTTGNALGIAMNSTNTDNLIRAFELADKSDSDAYIRYQKALIKSGIVHEMTHNIRGGLDDAKNLKGNLKENEVPSHANQFLSIWDSKSSFFTSRLNDLEMERPDSVGRIHAEIGGLHRVYRQLNSLDMARYKPRNFTPQELVKSIESISESQRHAALKRMIADNVMAPVSEFQKDVEAVFERFRPDSPK